jgi:ribose-phosphate pyrophosphokinase
MPKFLKYILNQPAIDLFKLTIVAPDLNGAKRCHKYARRLQASVERKFGRKCFIPITIINKERLDDSEHPEIQEVIGSEYLHGRDLVILDDEILGGGTLTEVLQIVSQYKIGKIFAMMSHGVLSGKALERINNSPMERLVITDTIEFLNPPEKIEIISVADDFAELIKRIHTGRSVSEMDVFGRIQE